MISFTFTNGANSLLRDPSWTKKKKKMVSLIPILFLLCGCFFAPVHGQHIQETVFDCNMECGPDETCVPDRSPTFGKLMAHRYSGILPSHCKADVEEALGFAHHEAAERDADNLFPEDVLLASSQCPYDCQNGGTCISIFGGLSYACVCVEPFWGTQCEIDGTKETCELDCAESIDGVLPHRTGAFCVESPENLVYGFGSQTCVHCEELAKEEEPICEDVMDCKNGGVCQIEYQFVTTNQYDSKKDSAVSKRPFKCSSSTTETISEKDGSTSSQMIWTDLPSYKVSCVCQPGYQGETCEEIDICGTGCKNNGYCISNDTPDDNWSFDDFFNANAESDDTVDDFAFPVRTSQLDCTSCFQGRCNQDACGPGAICLGGMCNQDYLLRPVCPGGKCSQRYARFPSCVGGDCDQTATVGATCAGSDCFQDQVEAQTLMPDTTTLPPDFPRFCSCAYGYVGKYCELPITAICVFDDLEHNRFLHTMCLQLGKLCPLEVGDRFCTNGGRCGNVMNDASVSNDINDGEFTCICPIGFEGVHCEIIQTPPSSLEPLEENMSPSSSAAVTNKWNGILALFISVQAYCGSIIS